MKDYFTEVNAKDIEVKTESLVPSLGMKLSPSDALPRPDLAGVRIKSNDPKIYLINPEGILQWIPDSMTYNNLFLDFNGVVLDINLNGNFIIGEPLTSGAILVRGDRTPWVYFLSNNIRRWITSPRAMDKWHLNPSKVYIVPPILVFSIPENPNHIN
jgi:hypothetical protein